MWLRIVSTRATLRARVRDELNDNGSTKLWSDALLNEWIADAILPIERHPEFVDLTPGHGRAIT